MAPDWTQTVLDSESRGPMPVRAAELREMPPRLNCWPPMEWRAPAGQRAILSSMARDMASHTPAGSSGCTTRSTGVELRRDWTSLRTGIVLRGFIDGNLPQDEKVGARGPIMGENTRAGGLRFHRVPVRFSQEAGRWMTGPGPFRWRCWEVAATIPGPTGWVRWILDSSLRFGMTGGGSE